MSRSRQVNESLYSVETDQPQKLLTTAPEGTPSTSCLPKRYQMRKIKSKGAMLVLAWVFLVCSAFTTAFWISTEHVQPTAILRSQPAAIVILSVSCPFAGWLADIYLGRYRVMRLGLWLMWIGVVVGVLTMAVQYNVCESDARHPVLGVGITVTVIMVTAGFACVMVNSVQFGMDQMPDASGEQISAFIHWYVWAVFAGYGVAQTTSLLNLCTHISLKCAKLQTYQTIVPCALLSLALCSNFLFKDWLTIEPQSQNPLKTVVRVLKFAATHKRPIMQSAFTYCGEAKPSRIDLGKTRYGGPFTTEEVEDVKTCLRMQVVIVSTLAFFIPGELYLISRSFIKAHFQQNANDSSCFQGALYSEAVLGILFIPLYEFLVYPLFRNRIPSMIKRVGIGSFLTIALNLVLLSTDAAGHLLSHHNECMFSSSVTSEKLGISYIWVALPSNILVTLQISIFFISAFEFTCAQAPYSMRGLLIGLVYSLLFSTFPVSYGIFVAWYEAWKRHPESKPMSCEFWFFLFQVLIAGIGLISILVVAKWYKNRQREEPCRDRQFVEDFYERYCVLRTDAQSP